MMASASDTGNNGKTNPPLHSAMTESDSSSSALPVQADQDMLMGRHVAREVMRRNPAERRAQMGVEPEEVGGRGSRQYRCIVTGEIHGRDEMFRFGISPDNKVVPDLEESLPGRGYWVTANHDILGRAIKENAFMRAVGRPVDVSPALASQVIELARQTCLNLFGLARRAWAVELGYDFVRAGLVSRKLGLIFIASNAPLEFRTRLESLTRDIPVLTLFTTAQLSSALGQQSLAFVGIQKGQWSARLLAHCVRLSRVLSITDQV